MRRKINWIIACLSLIGLPGLIFCGSVSAEVVDRIVAIVDNDIITMLQLNKESARYLKNIENAGYPEGKREEMTREIHKKMLNMLIDSSLTQQEAKRYRITVPESDIDNAVENVKKSKSISQEEFESALEQEGLSLAEYRENIKRQILQARLINTTVKSKVIITEADIQKRYETDAHKYAGKKKYYLRNILSDDGDKIREIKQALDKNEKFSDLATRHSMAPNAADGGELGLFDIDNFSDSIQESISKLSKGDYTDVIPTPQGFQIFYIQDIVLADHKTYDQAHEEIREILYREQVEKKFETWFESLKKKAHIKIMI
jgi:peptidyl-prolyl cis-trans isomerase SurA